MKLLNSDHADVLDKEVTVKELISIRAIFGEFTLAEFNKVLNNGKNDEEINLKSLIDRIIDEHTGTQGDIYDDVGKVLNQILN